jgi:hypothetical protein
VVNEDLVRAVEEKIQENRQFTISPLFLHFIQISQSLLREIVSDKPRGLLLLFIVTANGFSPGGNGTTIRHNTQTRRTASFYDTGYKN